MLKSLLWPIRLLYCLYAFLLFIAGMLLVFPLVILFSIEGTKKGGDCIYRVCRWWDNAWLVLTGMQPQILHETGADQGRRYVFISNHISYLDIPMILQAVPRDSLRILGKAEMARIPIFGYIYRQAVVMVNRGSIKDRSRSVRDLKDVLANDLSIFIFPEGTFNETRKPLKEFYDGAFRIAIEMQTPLQPILFLDNYDRMHYSSVLTLTPGRMRAVYLPTVEVKGLTPEDVPHLRELVYRLMEDGLHRYGASWITNVS